MKWSNILVVANKTALALLFLPYPALADTLSLEAYLKSMDLAEITFVGHIKYEKSSLSDVDFTYYNADGEPFAVTIDAGRKTRERIENECESTNFMVSRKNLCEITGNGTIEIRGSRIHLSVDEVTSLTAP